MTLHHAIATPTPNSRISTTGTTDSFRARGWGRIIRLTANAATKRPSRITSPLSPAALTAFTESRHHRHIRRAGPRPNRDGTRREKMGQNGTGRYGRPSGRTSGRRAPPAASPPPEDLMSRPRVAPLPIAARPRPVRPHGTARPGRLRPDRHHRRPHLPRHPSPHALSIAFHLLGADTMTWRLDRRRDAPHRSAGPVGGGGVHLRPGPDGGLLRLLGAPGHRARRGPVRPGGACTPRATPSSPVPQAAEQRPPVDGAFLRGLRHRGASPRASYGDTRASLTSARRTWAAGSRRSRPCPEGRAGSAPRRPGRRPGAGRARPGRRRRGRAARGAGATRRAR